MRESIVRLHGVTKVYPGSPPLTALAPSDLEVSAGDYLTVTGPSGSGKSTLLNLLGLLDRPSGGRYVLAGQDVTTMRERDRTGMRAGYLGFVFQAYHLMAQASVLDNVTLGLLYRGTRRVDRDRAALAALTRVGLAERADARPGQLSGGQRQRVAIARALVGAPSLLLCDEPTGNLDSSAASAVLACIDELRAQGQTIVLITHDADVARRGSRRIDIHDGVVREQS